MAENVLYYGDNLDILQRYIKDETIDLIYLDPPFKSNQDYNVLFAEQNGSRSAAQIKAFGDTWRWDKAAARAYHEAVERGSERVSQVMQAFHTFLGENDMMAYLAMMAPRSVELHRVLKSTGSIYLHCDPTASHYLKMLMDAVFGAGHFKNEIVWRYSWGVHTDKRWNRKHDTLLFYAKSNKFQFNAYAVMDRREAEVLRRLATGVESATMAADKHKHADKTLKLPNDVWNIPTINAMAKERLGYPTQKPEALLERIIQASSRKGDIILDPFCGCGTTIAVAQKLKRSWIGIDITHLAVALMKHRLENMFGEKIRKTYEVVGEPTDLSGAKQLAKDDPYQFQWWALGLVGARPVEQKKGADKGIDGRLYFHDEADISKARTKQIIISVKAGHVSVPHIRDLRGVIERENAEIGVLLSMENPTKPMRTEAASAGFYKSTWQKEPYPRLQILTVEELLNGKRIDCPPLGQVNVTFKKAPKAKSGTTVTQPHLFHKERKEPAEN